MHLLRPFAPFVSCLFLFVAACEGSAGDGDSTPSRGAGETGPVDAPPAAAAGGSTAPAAPSSPAPSGTFDLRGLVVSYGNAPIASRAIRVVDAKHNRIDAFTDATGSFVAKGVTAPYDVKIAPAGATDAPTVYMGLAKDAVVLLANVVWQQPAPETHHTFKLGLNVPACNSASCELLIVTRSADGSGGVSCSYGPGVTFAACDVTHSYHPTAANEAVTTHVLVHDNPPTWYSAFNTTLYSVGEGTTPGGWNTATPLPLRGTVTVGVASSAVPASWSKSIDLSITYSDGAVFSVASSRTDSLVAALPDVPGATFQVWSYLSEPGDSNTKHVAWSGSQPTSVTNVALTATAMPANVTPSRDSSLSVKSPGMSWSTPGSSLALVGLLDTAKRKEVVSIWTQGAAVSFESLDALGVSLPVGDMQLDLRTAPGIDLATITKADTKTRPRVFDYSAPGRATSQSWPFKLVP